MVKACLEMWKLESEPLQNVRNQIGFCGIWCGSCAAGNGAIIELAKRFGEIVEKHQLEMWVPKNFDFKEFVKGLAGVQAMPLCPGCRKGGGPPTCSVRMCALEKGVSDCSQCDQLMGCNKFEGLEKTNPTIKEGLMEIRNANQNQLIAKWTGEIEAKWPHCLVYCRHCKK